MVLSQYGKNKCIYLDMDESLRKENDIKQTSECGTSKSKKRNSNLRSLRSRIGKILILKLNKSILLAQEKKDRQSCEHNIACVCS